MLKDEEIKEIILKSNLADVEQLEVIRRYIYDHKGIDVGTIDRPRGIPISGMLQQGRVMLDYQYMDSCYSDCIKYYYEKLL